MASFATFTKMDTNHLVYLVSALVLLNVCCSDKATTVSSCYNGTCLTYLNASGGFADAVELCKSRREQVLFIEDDVTQNNSLHLLGRLSKEVPIWLNMRNIKFPKWRYVKTEEEYVEQIEESPGDCVYLQIGEEGMVTKPFAADCQMKKHFICRRGPARGPCKDCFLYNTTLEVSWFAARQLCQDGGRDLDLAFWSKMDFSKSPGLSKLNYGGHFWIGLRKAEWTWQNGEPVRYNNFSGRYPIPGTDCGLLLSDGTWATSHCGDRFGVVCRTPKRNVQGKLPIHLPTTPPRQTPSSSSSSILSILTSSMKSPKYVTPTSQTDPQYHKEKNMTAAVILAGTLATCFVVIFIFTFIAFWCLKKRSRNRKEAAKANIAANIASITADPRQPPEMDSGYANPSFVDAQAIQPHLEHHHHHHHGDGPISPIAESNYIYFGGPTCQYDVIYTDVMREDINRGASTSGE